MKKTLLALTITLLVFPELAFAQSLDEIFGTVKPPSQIGNLGTGEAGINSLLDNIVKLFFAAGAMAFIIMFVWGALAMILSGGDKEAVSKARARITWAIVGVALLSFSYLILSLIQYITGIRLFA